MSQPTEQLLTLDAALAQHLVTLLRSHGVDSTLRGTDVLVEGDEAKWARLRTSPDSTASVLRIQVEVATADGTILVDTLNGLGDEVAARLDDVLTQFCIADFHVLLAGVWGLLEEDQVDHHVVATDNGRWDLYLGPWLSRMSEPTETIPPPEEAFAEALLDKAAAILTERKPTAGRVFVASLKGEMAYEGLVDGMPHDALESLLRSLPLEHSVTGYASQRHFFLAIPQDGGTAHRKVSRCTTVASEHGQKAPRNGLVLAIILLVAVIAIVAHVVLQ